MSEKHAVWLVPNYDNRGSVATAGHPVTYLRLGSMTSTVNDLSTPALRGDDLLELAGLTSATTAFFFDDTNGGVDRNQSGAGTNYKRYDGNSTDPSTASTLTAQLMTRGGWRDHTDGNRISTTRGDRYDFVQGNYKRVVFGRVEESVAGFLSKSTWESSGGHNHDTTSTPGEVTSIQWVSTQSGTWKVVEYTEKGNTLERFSGKKEEHFDGDHLESYIGVSGGTGKQNPVIKEKTTATSIVSTTNATTIDDETEVEKSVKEKTKLKGTSTETEWANQIEEYTGKIGEEVVFFNDHLIADKIENTTKFGTRTNISVSAVTISLELVGNSTEQVGLKFIDPPADPPPTYARLAFWLGPKLSIDVGVSASMWIGTKAVANIGNKISLGLTGDLELHFVATDLNLKRAWARISDFKTTLADIHLGVQANRLAAYRGHGV